MSKKHHYSYNHIHTLLAGAVASLKSVPDVLVPISGGGLIPARILRTLLKAKFGKTVPIKVIGLQLYDDDTETILESGVKRTQWPREHDWDPELKSVLLVDEVDDTRTTLQYAVESLRKDFGPEVKINVFVVHDKQKEKRGTLPADVEYIAALKVEDVWIAYPWDAIDIDEHQKIADEQRVIDAALVASPW
ncbi:phosphoribosyltransferase-like protein [Fimicolochytrium jonesii]|uniref:phosphoribosyltransferase-like protein n=1 Tax=Fimicolochytrium jonesii TaxID=1396493 RepID=UPI0022FF1BA2|nr:phosphoribosyltransferase-like protein [Fimicolochytrium jonesii]KAI8824904.1 phosphoribosyltransferase-like protein [Fimicolochytrium jonesii]